MLLPTIEIVTYISNMCMLLLYIIMHYEQPKSMSNSTRKGAKPSK
jgi:hypothetical protein